MALDLEDNQVYYPWKNKEKKMDKQEFFDKIDNIRQIVMESKREGYDDTAKVIELLQELREDAEQVIEDEYDAGFDLGVDRVWNHIDKDEM